MKERSSLVPRGGGGKIDCRGEREQGGEKKRGGRRERQEKGKKGEIGDFFCGMCTACA
jgi:hypothetical protein